MSTRRDALPEALLERVIRALEDDRPRDAVLLLLRDGPLYTRTAYDRERTTPTMELFDDPTPVTSVVGAELLAYVRAAVRLRGSRGDGPAGRDTGYGIATTGIIKWTVTTDARGVVTRGVETDTRTAAILQFQELLSVVDFRHVDHCAAVDCETGFGEHRRVIIKTYGREYCSVRCQKRTLKRAERQAAREQREKQQARARRRRATQGEV